MDVNLYYRLYYNSITKLRLPLNFKCLHSYKNWFLSCTFILNRLVGLYFVHTWARSGKSTKNAACGAKILKFHCSKRKTKNILFNFFVGSCCVRRRDFTGCFDFIAFLLRNFLTFGHGDDVNSPPLAWYDLSSHFVKSINFSHFWQWYNQLIVLLIEALRGAKTGVYLNPQCNFVVFRFLLGRRDLKPIDLR